MLHAVLHVILTCNLFFAITGTLELEQTCGRPLGMRFDRYGINLIVADAYFGLLEVNPRARTINTLVPPSPGINGKPFRFVNDLDIARDGTIYFTDSSTKWQRRDVPYLMFEGDATGRLMAYHPKTGDMEVLMEGLHFANGVQLSPEGDHLLVAETTTSRIMKYVDKGDLISKYFFMVNSTLNLHCLHNLTGNVQNVQNVHFHKFILNCITFV